MATKYRTHVAHATPRRLAAVAILALAAALRLYRLIKRSAWTDETFVMQFVAEYTAVELLYRIAIDYTPPLW